MDEYKEANLTKMEYSSEENARDLLGRHCSDVVHFAIIPPSTMISAIRKTDTRKFRRRK